VMREAGVKEGLPADAVACMTSATIEGTEALMKHKQTALILATGGIGLVRAAYSSGKPAFGVGPGNVPVFIERTADVPVAVQNILTGKTFDNGTICASEQAVVADSPVAKQVREEFARQGGHWLSASEADQLAKVVATPQRGLNPAIVGRSVEVIAKMAGLSVPQGTRCLMVDVGGVGREHPLSMEKLSPILAFYVEDGVERGAARCFEILSYGGMGHTAGVHTRSREIAIAYGREMPASRVVVNTPTTHGAIGFSTALPPSMTLGCGSWGGNVTSDNISPLHLMDIKRVAFETRAVPSKRPARAGEASQVASVRMNAPAPQQPAAAAQGGRINREEVAAIVDRFLAGRGAEQQQGAPALHTELHASSSSPPAQSVNEINPNWMDAKSSAAPHAEAAPTARDDNGGGNGHAANAQAAPTQTTKPAASAGGGAQSSTNGRKAVDFVSEDDVRRAVQKGEKI
jgi:acetaldehyde dehydrogenase (acetylating)